MQWALKTKVIKLCNYCHGNPTIQGHLEAHRAMSLHSARGHDAPCGLCSENSFGHILIKTTSYKLDSSN